MDRRGFLVGSAAVAAAGCASRPVAPEIDAHEAAELVARLDRGLGTIDATPRGAIAAQMPWQVRPDLSEHVLRRTLEGLIVYDVAESIGAERRAPRSLMERIAREQPRVARSVRTHHALLASMPPAIRRNLGLRVRERPEVTSNVAEWLDAHARELGVARENRLRLRSSVASIATRMRRQSASAVIDDVVARVELASARRGGALLAGGSATTAMIAQIWQDVEGMPSGGGGPRSPGELGAFVPDEETEVYPEGRRWNHRWDRPGDEEIEIGAILMAFFCPSGGTLLIAGLIVLIAGVVQNEEWNGESEAQRRAREEEDG